MTRANFLSCFQHFSLTDFGLTVLFWMQRIYILVKTSPWLSLCICAAWWTMTWKMFFRADSHRRWAVGQQLDLNLQHREQMAMPIQGGPNGPFWQQKTLVFTQVGWECYLWILISSPCFLIAVFISEGSISLMPVVPCLCDWEIMWFTLFVLGLLLPKWDI